MQHSEILSLQQVAIFSDINLSAGKGELVALIGKNGVGKSTLLRTIARLQQPLSGAIQFQEQPLHAYSRSAFARMVSFVSTEIVNIANLSVFDFVLLNFRYLLWV